MYVPICHTLIETLTDGENSILQVKLVYQKGPYMEVISQIINCKKAAFVIIDKPDDKANQFISIDIATNNNSFFQDKYNHTELLYNNPLKAKRLIQQNRYIIADSDETKVILTEQFDLTNKTVILIIDLAKEILPKYALKDNNLTTSRDVFGLFFLLTEGKKNITDTQRQLLAVTNELLFFHHIVKEVFPIRQRSPIIDYLIEQNVSPVMFVSIAPVKNTYDEKSFICSHFTASENRIFECRYHYNSSDDYFNRIQNVFNNIKYIVCYGDEASQYLESLFKKHNTQFNFITVDLKDISSQIFKLPPTDLSLLFRRFLQSSWLDFCVEGETHKDLLLILENLIEEYKEVRDNLPE